MECTEFRVGKRLQNGVNSLIEQDYNGIIGVEAATGYWGLSTYNIDKSILLFNDDRLDNDGIFVEGGLCFLFVPNVNTDNIVKLSQHLRITDREQTICDMVRYNRHEFHLYETLLNMYDGDINIDRLRQLADRYGIWDRMMRLYQDALEVGGEG